MEQSKQEEVLKIGKKIIETLDTGDEHRLELLEKWMSHYIAELIYKAEHADSETEKERYQKECFETILKLWEKRSSAPMYSMPLRHIKPAIDALSNFKEENESWKIPRNVQSRSWEKLAVKIHETYLEAVRICLKASIADDAMGHEKVWIENFGDSLSAEEKQMIEELDLFLEGPSYGITFVNYGEEKAEIEDQKNRIDIAFDRLEAILDEQKKAMEEWKKAFKEK